MISFFISKKLGLDRSLSPKAVMLSGKVKPGRFSANLDFGVEASSSVCMPM